MAKYRVRVKKTFVVIKGKLERKEQVNERELNYLSQNTISGLFLVSYDGKKQLTYQAPVTLSLETYLKKNVLSEAVFWQLVSQIVEAARAVERRGLYPTHLLMEKDAIFVEEDSKKLFFVYQPITGVNLSSNVLALLEDLVYQEMKKGGGVQQSYLVLFQNYLPQSRGALENLKHYIDQVTGNEEKSQSPKRERDDVSARNPSSIERTGRPGPNNATVLLSNSGKVKKEEEIRLTRVKGNVQLSFSQNSIYLGKSSVNDYCVQGNESISRSHAVIERQGTEYFLRDLKSTNGTFLNGEALEGEEFYGLQSGDRILLADEEFIFEIP